MRNARLALVALFIFLVSSLPAPAQESEPLTVETLEQAAQAIAIPICGIGGIASAEDAIKFLLCGASAVQVGTLNYLDPAAAGEIVTGIAGYCEQHGVERVADLVGTVEFPPR